MQEEVSKHLRKIYVIAKKTRHSIGEKIREILIEIFIIIFAVTLSIKLHSYSEHKHQQKETKEFLLDLKDDLLKDIKWMKNQKASINQNVKPYIQLTHFTPKQIDSVVTGNCPIGLPMIIVIQKTNNGNYDGFKSSGKIGFIENKKLKKYILDYYQNTTPSIHVLEDILNTQYMHILDVISQENFSKKKFFETPVQTRIGIAVGITNELLRNYDLILKDANDIVREIDKETKE
jgi:hypothetical protein